MEVVFKPELEDEAFEFSKEVAIFSKINCPKPQKSKKGNYLSSIKNKPASIVSFVDGKDKLKLNLPIVSIAKRLEELFIPGKTESLRIAKNSPALNLLKQLRDEAHRFAITFQRQKRTKGIAKSKFEDIPSVGKKTVEKIYKRFQKTSDMKELSNKALAYKLGVSPAIAKEIKKVI